MPDRHKTRRHLIRELEKTRKRLEELEAAAGTQIDGIPDLVCRVRPDTTLTDVNDAYLGFVGRPREELLGRSFLELLPEEDREALARHVESIGASASRQPIEHRVFDASGRAHWLEWVTQPVFGEGGEVVEIIAAGRDVTARRRSERARDVLFRISEAAHSADSLEQLYRSIHEAVADLIDAPNLYIALLDDEWQRVEFAYWSDERELAHPGRPLEHGLTEYVLRNGRPLLAGPEDLEELSRSGVAQPLGEPPRYWLGVPLESEAGVFGVLAVFSYGEPPGDMREAGELLRFVSQQVADAIRRREAAEAKAARARQLDALRRVGLELAAELDLGTLLDSITQLATRLLEGDAGELWLQKGSPARPVRAVTTHGAAGGAEGAADLVEALVSRVWRLGESLVERREDGSADVAAPIRLGAELLGVLHVHQVDRHAGRRSDAEVLGLFGIQAAIALRNARLFAKARRDAATREALVHEVNHRVKNNLSSIIGLLYAARKQGDARSRAHYEPIMRDLISRVHGLEVAHRLLSEADWSALELSELVRAVIVAVVQAGPPALQIEACVEDSPLRVVAHQVGNVALLVNELATNSLKHALGGRSALRIAAHCAAQDGAILLEYRDDGPGYPKEVLQGQRGGAGLQLLTSIAERSLRADVELLNDGGAVARIRLPVGVEAATPADGIELGSR